MGVIYMATNLINGKKYIGQTKRNFEKRKAEHLKARDNYTFHLALRKYGHDNFKWTILENCIDEKLNVREQYWISFYDSYNNGYNSTTGGDNAEALVNWIKNNQDLVKKRNQNGLKVANKYWQDNLEKKQEQLKLAHKAAGKATSQKVECIELHLCFDSLAAAEEWSKSSNNPNGKTAAHQHISKVCKGQRKTCGGYHWKYI